MIKTEPVKYFFQKATESTVELGNKELFGRPNIVP